MNRIYSKRLLAHWQVTHPFGGVHGLVPNVDIVDHLQMVHVGVDGTFIGFTRRIETLVWYTVLWTLLCHSLYSD